MRKTRGPTTRARESRSAASKASPAPAPAPTPAKKPPPAASGAGGGGGGGGGGAPKTDWAQAVDESGRTYYYHTRTQETRWDQPPSSGGRSGAAPRASPTAPAGGIPSAFRQASSSAGLSHPDVVRALDLKEQGNKLHTGGSYAAAIGKYLSAIEVLARRSRRQPIAELGAFAPAWPSTAMAAVLSRRWPYNLKQTVPGAAAEGGALELWITCQVRSGSFRVPSSPPHLATCGYLCVRLPVHLI